MPWPRFGNFKLRKSPALAVDPPSDRKLYDAAGRFRGELRGGGFTMWPSLWDIKRAGWEDFGKEKHILLDAYRPQRLPYAQDWVLVLEAQQ